MSDETTTLDVAGLKELAGAAFFLIWEDEDAGEPEEVVEASRAVMQKTAHKLVELGPVARTADVLAVLQGCIEAFNELDTRWGSHWICTIQREDICDEFYRIVERTGLGDHPDLDDGTVWRDW
jgi:hypothetical protein